MTVPGTPRRTSGTAMRPVPIASSSARPCPASRAKNSTAGSTTSGANIAAATLLSNALGVKEAVLIRAMRTVEPAPGVRLNGTRVLVLSGTSDPIVTAENSRGLAGQLRSLGADVQLVELPVGHNLAPGDLAAARAFAMRG